MSAKVRGVLCLPEIGKAGQQCHRAVGAKDEALEEAETEAVVAGQPEHRFLLEQEERIEPVGLHGHQERVAAARRIRRA